MLSNCGCSHLTHHAPSIRSRLQTLLYHTRLSLPTPVLSGAAIQLKLASALAWGDEPILLEGEMLLDGSSLSSTTLAGIYLRILCGTTSVSIQPGIKMHMV